MGIEKSLEFEDDALHHPIPVQQAFNITGDNIRSIANCAYKTLNNEREFYTKLNEKVILRRALKEVGEDGAAAETNKENDDRKTTPKRSTSPMSKK